MKSFYIEALITLIPTLVTYPLVIICDQMLDMADTAMWITEKVGIVYRWL